MEENTVQVIPSFEEYVNLQRIAAGMAYGAVPELYNTMDWINEYKLIHNKKSKLSSKKRQIVVSTVENAKIKFEKDTASGTREHYNNLEKLVGTFLKFTQTLARRNEMYAI